MEFQVHFDQIEFGKRLREIRKNCGMTQAELAERLILSPDSISNYENGKSTCMPEHIIHMCQLFDLSADYFYFGKKNKLKTETKDVLGKINILLETCDDFDQERAYQMMLILMSKPV